MNRLSWDRTAPRRAPAKRTQIELRTEQTPHDDLLSPAWRELRRIHRF